MPCIQMGQWWDVRSDTRYSQRALCSTLRMLTLLTCRRYKERMEQLQRTTTGSGGSPGRLGLAVLTLSHIAEHKEAKTVCGPRGHSGAELSRGTALDLQRRREGSTGCKQG